MSDYQPSVLSAHLPPLAERIRPRRIDEFIGQKKITNCTSLIIKAIQNKRPFSMILWGPPGTGKTTLARIIGIEFDVQLFELSAVSSGIAQVRQILKQGKNNFEAGRRSILFIDEIHRFNKTQQDALLHAVEEGTIILIGATTENPSFEIISPLLSRCRVLRLYALTGKELYIIINRAISKDILLSQKSISFDGECDELLIQSCGGDARKMLNVLELAISLHSTKKIKIISDNIKEALQQKNIIYDKDGDYHYDVISAFIKSIRGSDPDAAIYWLAVMLESGEKPEFIARRLIVLASEDIGNSEPYALQLAMAAFDAVHCIGMPESRIILGQITTYLASVPKSNASYQAIDAAIAYVREYGAESVPLHLRNASSTLMKNEGYGENYKYAHSFKKKFVKQSYFPETFTTPTSFYNPTNQGREKILKEYLANLWGNRFNK